LVIWSWIDRDLEKLAGLFIKDVILSFASILRNMRIAHHLADLVGIGTGAVNDPSCKENGPFCRYLIQVFFP